MRTTTVAAIEAYRATTPPGYVDALLAAGTVRDGRHYIDDRLLAAVRQRYGLPPVRPMGVLPQVQGAAPAAAAVTGAVAAAGTVAGQPAGLPSLLQQARNVAAAAGRVVAAAAAGEAVQAPEAVQRERGLICRGGAGQQPCPDWLPGQDRCRLCGCPLRRKLVGKLELATESCPAGKWGRYLPG